MGINKKILSAIALFTFVIFSFPSSISASENDPRIITLGQDEVVNEDYFAAGDRVEIYGTVNGDVYAAGGEIIVDGKINGDLLAAGGTITISGEVTQDVRVAGGDIDISAKIGRNLTFGAGDINVLESAQIAGSIVGGAGNAVLSSTVGQNVKVGAGNLSISNKVGGKVEVGAENIRVTSKGEIGKDLTYWSQYDASIDESATIGGTVTKKSGIYNYERQEKDKNSFERGKFAFWLITSLLVGLALFHFFPTFSRNTAKIVFDKPIASLGHGFLYLIGAPIAIIILMVTILGIPFALILLPLYIIDLYLAKFFVILALGFFVTRKLEKGESTNKSFLAGLVIFAILKMIPVVRFFTGLLALLLGLGALKLSFISWYKESRQKNTI